MTLELKHVEKVLGQDVHIHPTDLVLEPGRFNILLGTTLAGKTTLMTLMAGLERPTSGQIWFNGRDVTHDAVQKRNISMVYQQFINYPNFSVYENIASPLRVARVGDDEIRTRVGQIAEILHISQMLDRRPDELSGGQQQRCAMARAMIKDSDLILLDEPLANLDFKLREELREELPRLFSQRDRVVVYATTEPTEALLLGGWSAAMHEGRVVDYGPTERVYRHPCDLTTARVFSEPPMNLAEVKITNAYCTLADGVGWPVTNGLADGRYTIGLRPHHVLVQKNSPSDVAISGQVIVAELSGSETTIHFNAYGSSWVSLSHGVHPFGAGETVTLFADMNHCFYFDASDKLVASSNLNEGQ